MRKPPKRKRPPKLSLYPLSLEDALKKALSLPLIPYKKEKRKCK